MIVQYNTNNWPYVKIKFLNNSVSDNGFNEHLKNFKDLYKLCEEKNKKMIIIFDLREIPAGTIKYIRKQVKFNKEVQPLSKIWLEQSFFLTSTIGKTILDLVFSFEKPVSPYTIFSNEKDLINYIEKYDKNKILNNEEVLE